MLLQFACTALPARGGSALARLQAGVLLVDHEAPALADDDLAVLRATSDAAADFHGVRLSCLSAPARQWR